jgi:hypothetical protein
MRGSDADPPRRTVDEATRQRPQGGLRLRARLKGRMQASSARSGQRLVQCEPGPGALARARDGVTDSSASKGRGHGRNSGERFCGRPGENDAQTMYRGERNVSVCGQSAGPLLEGRPTRSSDPLPYAITQLTSQQVPAPGEKPSGSAAPSSRTITGKAPIENRDDAPVRPGGWSLVHNRRAGGCSRFPLRCT